METVTIKEITDYLESWAPRAYQESYDNCGLLTGDPATVVKGILVTLDSTEVVIDEAIAAGCNLVVAHHPIIFKGLKKLTGQSYVERTVIKAIKNNIAIYAIHTNLDNVATGVNRKIATQIGLKNCKVLLPKGGTLMKLVTFIPTEAADQVTQALHDAGAGNVGHYKNCSFQISGQGKFTPTEKAKPLLGEANKPESVLETRVEVIMPAIASDKIIQALRHVHPYEEVAYYLSVLENENQDVGAGLIGDLEAPVEPIEFLQRLKREMNTACIRHTALPAKKIQRVAVCGGAGSFLLPAARAAGAEAFVSADFKYHEFFDAEGKIMIADVGHYESEQYTKTLLAEVLKEKFSTFAINFSKSITNPISYI